MTVGGAEDRLQHLELHLADRSLADCSLQQLADMTPGYSVADLQALCREAVFGRPHQVSAPAACPQRTVLAGRRWKEAGLTDLPAAGVDDNVVEQTSVIRTPLKRVMSGCRMTLFGAPLNPKKQASNRVIST